MHAGGGHKENLGLFFKKSSTMFSFSSGRSEQVQYKK
jgi:hypothetical protein